MTAFGLQLDRIARKTFYQKGIVWGFDSNGVFRLQQRELVRGSAYSQAARAAVEKRETGRAQIQRANRNPSPRAFFPGWES